MPCAKRTRAERACYPSARVHSFSPPPACWTGSGQAHTGGTRMRCSGVIRGSVWIRMCLYVDEDGVLTSAGSAAGLDLCLHLVRKDFGSAIANHVARRLVISPHRDGGQRQFLERPVDHHAGGGGAGRDSLAALLDRIRRRLDEPWRIADVARVAAMSERTLMRRFRAATGSSPADWITGARVDRARELLESTAMPIERIAERCGLGSPSTLRHHFRKKVGVSPADYRKRFTANPS
jgi:AraC family transcriptional regulator, transcriptional activator FtrA